MESAAPLRMEPSVEVDPAHSRLGGERNERSRTDLALAEAMLLLREDDDGSTLRSLVGEARELRRVCELEVGHTREWKELGRLAVAERDRSRLVEEEGGAVSGCLDGAARECQHIASDEPVHARDADCREQTADGRGYEADEQRDEDDHALLGVRVDGERLQRDDRDHEHDRQPGEQDVERDLVRGLLSLRPLDERDHPVEEALARDRQ